MLFLHISSCTAASIYHVLNAAAFVKSLQWMLVWAVQMDTSWDSITEVDKFCISLTFIRTQLLRRDL